jgi:hypothetical protein
LLTELAYYIQASLFVKGFAGPDFNFFLSDNSLGFAPVFWGESELYAFARSCQGVFQNSFGCFCNRFFVLFVPDSKA